MREKGEPPRAPSSVQQASAASSSASTRRKGCPRAGENMQFGCNFERWVSTAELETRTRTSTRDTYLYHLYDICLMYSSMYVIRSCLYDSAAAVRPPLLYLAMHSGNLGEVTQLSECEYDIKIRPDTNNNRHRLWFYFSVHTTLCQQVVRGLGLELRRGCRTHTQTVACFAFRCSRFNLFYSRIGWYCTVV